MSQKQLTVKYIIEDMLRYQVTQARNARFLRVPDDAARFTISTPEIATKDIAKFSTAAQQIATALVSAEMQEWIDKETARRIFASVMSFSGVDMDFEQIRTALAEQKDKEGYEDYRKEVSSE